MEFENTGKLFLLFGALFLIIGGLMLVASRFGLSKLPGDIQIQGDGFSFYFPIISCLVLSIILTLLLKLFWRQ